MKTELEQAYIRIEYLKNQLAEAKELAAKGYFRKYCPGCGDEFITPSSKPEKCCGHEGCWRNIEEQEKEERNEKMRKDTERLIEMEEKREQDRRRRLEARYPDEKWEWQKG